ncbi:MAG: glycosyltransferase family 2 protein [Deltaproteobacteria bacterium]|nr:glycosyltransferase family 2 protein [Deltaproteobacteria bacterium]
MPFVTVIIRSYKRLEAVRALVELVLRQRYEPFEVLIVDSTPGLDAEAVLRACSNGDPRVRCVWSPPRGCAAAANAGVREARGEVVAFVDDDDLPVGDGWLAAHAKAYKDPRCLGVNGRMDYTGEGPERVPRVRSGWLRDRWMLSYGPFKKPRVFPGSPTRKVGIEWLTGGNSSLRREVWERAGGWDEFLRYHNEHSLFLRLARVRRPGEYLLYDPEARMIIRRDVPGGLDHRTRADLHERVDTLARYYFWLVGRYHPVRIFGLLPLFFPYFVLDAGVHAAELAEHTGADLLGAFLEGAAYAPRSAAKHLFAPRA